MLLLCRDVLIVVFCGIVGLVVDEVNGITVGVWFLGDVELFANELVPAVWSTTYGKPTGYGRVIGRYEVDE